MSSEIKPIDSSEGSSPSHWIKDAVTVRSILCGIAVILFAEGYITWAMSHLASRLNRAYLPMGLLFPFLLLVLGNTLLHRLGIRCMLRQPELRVVLGMGLIGAFFPYFGIAAFLPGIIAAPFYLDTHENGWREHLHDHLPTWLVLRNEDGAATLFYEGLSPVQSIPWTSWYIPLFWWGTLIGAIGWTTFCIMSIIRKQWVEHERLEYPLMTVGIRLTADVDDPDSIAQMIRQRGFQMGFSMGMIAVMWNVVTFFYPLIPQIPTTPTASGFVQWLAGAPTVWNQFSVYIFGFAYFARVEALLSFWVFFVLTGIEMVVFDRLGVGSSVGQGGLEAIRIQSIGALIMIVIITIFMARKHLREVLRKAIRGDSDIDDSKEALSYRAAVFGMGTGLLYMGGWWYFAGMEIKVLLFYLTFTLIAYIGLSRIVAEVGLPYANISDTALNWAPFYILGSQHIAPSTMAIQGFLYAVFSTTRGFLGPSITQTLKLTSGLSFTRTRLLQAVGLAMVIGFVVSITHTIWMSYRLGGYNLGELMFVPRFSANYQRGITWMRNPEPPDVDRLILAASGMFVVLILTVLRYYFTRWPLTPVGLALQGKYMARRLVFPVLLAWISKTIILKVGGVQLYRKGQPFIIGIMVGYAFAVFISTVIDHFFFYGQGHIVHDF